MDQNIVRYYRHARQIGAFRAADCLRLARRAVHLDAIRPVAAPVDVATECLPDGSGGIRFSRMVRVY